jgi:hypothetical protein
MENNYSHLMFVSERDPERLKKALMSIAVPSQIVPGSWYYSSMKVGVWVHLDRPVELMKRKSIKENTEVLVKTPTAKKVETNKLQEIKTIKKNEV